MKILLAYRCHDLGRMEFYSRFTPLGLGYINALLRSRGHDSRILNCSAWSWKRTERFLRQESPDVLGVSVFTFNRHEAMRLAADSPSPVGTGCQSWRPQLHTRPFGCLGVPETAT